MYLNTIIRSASALHASMFKTLIEHKVIFVAQKLVHNNCTIIYIFVYCLIAVNLRAPHCHHFPSSCNYREFLQFYSVKNGHKANAKYY